MCTNTTHFAPKLADLYYRQLKNSLQSRGREGRSAPRQRPRGSQPPAWASATRPDGRPNSASAPPPRVAFRPDLGEAVSLELTGN